MRFCWSCSGVRRRSWRRSRSRPNCLNSDSGTFCFNLRYSLPMQGRIWMPFLEIICADIVFKFCRYQGRGQRGATGVNAPARLSRARGPLARLCCVAVANFPGMRVGLLQPTELFLSVRGLGKAKSTAGVHWSGSYIRSSWGRFWRSWGPRGTEGRVH